MKFALDISSRTELKRYQKSVRDRGDYIKVTVLLFLDKGKSPEEIADDLGIDDSSVYRYVNHYQSEGIEKYLQRHHKGYWGQLSSTQLSALRTELNRHLYTDSKMIIEWVSREFAIDYTPTGMTTLLNRIGFSYKQTKQVPCEANIEKQVDFLSQMQEKLSAVKEDTKSVAYFLDAVHPTHNNRSTHAWIETGKEREQLTVSGRDRVNINGALNAHDPTDVIIVEADRINAQATQQLYVKLLQANPNVDYIFTFSDNARYYHNKELKEWLKDKPIIQIFLPPYSPNLNLIERLWKFCRKKVINTHFYRTKVEFKDAILKFFSNIGLYKDELVTLLTLNFHINFSHSSLR
jgi:transposase